MRLTAATPYLATSASRPSTMAGAALSASISTARVAVPWRGELVMVRYSLVCPCTGRAIGKQVAPGWAVQMWRIADSLAAGAGHLDATQCTREPCLYGKS